MRLLEMAFLLLHQIKKNSVFHISAQNINCGYSLEPPLSLHENIDCGYSLEPPRRGGSNEYPQSMFSSNNKKNNVYPCKPQFYYITVGFKGSKLYRHLFVMECTLCSKSSMTQHRWHVYRG